MIVLGIETAGPQGSVALLRPGHEPREIVFEASRRLGAELAPTIQGLIKDAGLGPEAPPDLVAVDMGPGSYTGLRIGIAAAKGLAFAWSRPLIGVPAVDALSRQAPAAAERVLCALDASRGEVYAALFRRSSGSVREERAPALHDPGRLGSSLSAPTLVIGDAAEALADDARGIVAADPSLAWPTATRIARLGLQRYLDGTRQDALELSPIYYRPNEAEVQRRKRSMRGR